jgi:anti-sigma regulatory factor (Ser/Thr protein kinase)
MEDALRHARSRSWDLQLRADRHAPSRARWFCWSKLAEHAPNEVEAALLLISELVTNAVRHGATDPFAPIDLTLELGSAPIVRVTVRDRGRGFAHPSAPPAPVIGGMGLRLVDTVSTRWGCDREGGTTLVWFEIG